MGKNKFTMHPEKALSLERIQGQLTAFERMEYPLTFRLSCPLAENGYGTVTVDGIPVPKGKEFTMDAMGMKMHNLTVGVGSVAREYDREYTVRLTGFTGKDGRPFADASFRFRTAKRRVKEQPYRYDAHDAVAHQAACESIVLLKNDNGVLPLRPDAVLNVFGRGQYVFYNTATGAGLINPRWQANFHEAIAEHSSFRLNREVSALYEDLENPLPEDALIAGAKAQSDTAIVVLSRVSGEFADNRPDQNFYYLTDGERELLRRVAAAFPKTVAIINSGYPIELGWVRDFDIDGVIFTGFGGQSAAYALMEVLDGRCCPSGKLPDSFPWDYYDHPSAHNFPNLKASDPQPTDVAFGTRIYYEEDIYVGYRYYDTFRKKTAFCFGHGLSYTDFSAGWAQPVWDGERVSVDVTVTNTGGCPGKEVIQLYIAAPEGRLEKPRRVLAAFEKTRRLAPGESQTLRLTAEGDTFASFSEEDTAYLLEAGRYEVYIGNSLDASRPAGEFILEADKILRKVQPVALPVEQFKRVSQKDPTFPGATRRVATEDRIGTPALRRERKPQPLPRYTGKTITFPQLQKDPWLLELFVAQMTDAELCRLNVCGGSNWYLPWQNGAAGKNHRLRKYKLPLFTVSDGNTGLNLKKPNIGFPSSASIAATFNKELAYQVGRVIAEESVENGIQLNLGPAQNIHRNILNGRHPEYFSEDPFLSGTMAGYHGKGLEENGCACCYKHLFCNGSDTARKASHSIVSQRALREIYFKTFEFALRIQKPSALMTSYNALNGIYPAENPELLQTLIREEWGLDSFIMTDWGTYDTVDPVEMVKAGNQWLTEGAKKYEKQLLAAVKDGRLSRAVLQQNVMGQMKLMLKWL